MICAACHTTEFTVVPGVTRWTEVYACDNCGTLKAEVKSVKSIKAVEKPKEGTGDS